MLQNTPGYSGDLFLLPFDHRGSLEVKLLGIKRRLPTAAEKIEIKRYKRLIFEAFKKSIHLGVPRDCAGILVDEEFGSEILEEAKTLGYITAAPVEKSGQDEFNFEYGSEFGNHIRKVSPSFVKVLVRFNPKGNEELNRKELLRLKKLSDYCISEGCKFMFELLIEPTMDQLAQVMGDPRRFDLELRSALMVETIREFQDHSIEPDIWKVEGIESETELAAVVAQARDGSFRQNVGVVILGRGEDEAKVKNWLRTAVKVPGVIGFAVGRTVFWQALEAVRAGTITDIQAIDKIAENFSSLCDLWMKGRQSGRRSTAA